MEKKISNELIRAARGLDPVDLLLENAQLVNVFSGEVYPASVAIWDPFVVGVLPAGAAPTYEARAVVDLGGRYLAPGFIDGHVHIESAMVEVPQFARAVVPRGTTSVVCDPHEISNVMGYDGIRYMLESSKYNPLNVFIMLPSCVPAAAHLETAGSELRAFDIYPFFREGWVLGLAEVMNFPGLLAGDPELLDKLKISHGKRIDGHAPGLAGRDLCAYAAAGIASDHECTSVEEAREKLRLGMHIMIREGTAAKNLEALLPLVTKENAHRCLFVTDDRHPSDLVVEGHMDHVLRKAIALGLDPVTAIQMATLNPARYFLLHNHGAIAPGYYADLVAFDSLERIEAQQVWKNGRLVAEGGRATWSPTERPRMPLRGSVNIRWLEGGEFDIPARPGRIRVIEVTEGQIVTGSALEEPKVEGGFVVADPSRDLAKLVVVERHRASGRMGFGFVRGFGLREGALASTIAHDSHNLICLGVDDESIRAAVVHLNKMSGGVVVARGGRIVGELPLPVAGLMTQRPLEEVHEALARLIALAHEQGVRLADPFMTLSFLALPVVPSLKLTDRGLVDVGAFAHVDLFVE